MINPKERFNFYQVSYLAMVPRKMPIIKITGKMPHTRRKAQNIQFKSKRPYGLVFVQTLYFMRNVVQISLNVYFLALRFHENGLWNFLLFFWYKYPVKNGHSISAVPWEHSAALTAGESSGFGSVAAEMTALAQQIAASICCHAAVTAAVHSLVPLLNFLWTAPILPMAALYCGYAIRGH